MRVRGEPSVSPQCPRCGAGLRGLLSPGPGGPRLPSTAPRGPSETARSRPRLAPRRPFPDSGPGPRGCAGADHAVCVRRGSVGGACRFQARTREKLRVSALGNCTVLESGRLAGLDAGSHTVCHFTSCACPAPHTQPLCCRLDSSPQMRRPRFREAPVSVPGELLIWCGPPTCGAQHPLCTRWIHLPGGLPFRDRGNGHLGP